MKRSRRQRTIAELAARHELHPNLITQWKRQAIEKLAKVFDAKGFEVQANRDTEMTKLHAKIGQLVVERDFWPKPSIAEPGSEEAGARAADQAMRLNPNPPLWARFFLRYAYFSVGRYEDAFLAQQRIPKESYTRWDYVMAASILTALDKHEGAPAAVADTLHAYPDTTVEGWISDPGFTEPERLRFADLMRKAGFPVCAVANDLKKNPNFVRLPECAQF